MSKKADLTNLEKDKLYKNKLIEVIEEQENLTEELNYIYKMRQLKNKSELTLEDKKEFADFLEYNKAFTDYSSQNESLDSTFDQITDEAKSNLMSTLKQKYGLINKLEDLRTNEASTSNYRVNQKAEEDISKLIYPEDKKEETIDPWFLSYKSPFETNKELTKNDPQLISWEKFVNENLASLPKFSSGNENKSKTYKEESISDLDKIWKNLRESWHKEDMEPSTPSSDSDNAMDIDVSTTKNRRTVRFASEDDVVEIDKITFKGKQKAEESHSPIINETSKLPSWFGSRDKSKAIGEPGPSKTPTNDFIDNLPQDFSSSSDFEE